MKMIERILEVIKAKQFSPSQFAEEIGVQRSNISHLISGRNKPSLEFLQKIIKRFPDINPEYLLSGNGNLFRDGSQTTLDFAAPSITDQEDITMQPLENEKGNVLIPEQKKVSKVEKRISEGIEKAKNNENIEKIVFFYKDKTFREYFPE